MMSRYVKKADRDKLLPGPVKHGGYSIHQDALIAQDPGVRLYLKQVRHGLIRDICPEGEAHLTTARRLLVDRLLQTLGTARLIETYLAKNGILNRGALAAKPGSLQAEPILATWMTLQHHIRLTLGMLGLERKAVDAYDLTAEQLGEKILQGAVERTNPGQGDEETGEACPVPGSGDDRGAEDHSGANSREAGPGAVDGGDLDEDGEA